jgi:putative FmdB family regulatory protein
LPTYEYRCRNGHTFEVMQRMADDPITVCEVCDEPVERVFHPVAVHFKGSGFYATDYGRARGGGGGDSSAKEDAKETATSNTDGSSGTSSSSGSSDSSGSSSSSGDSGSSTKSD